MSDEEHQFGFELEEEDSSLGQPNLSHVREDLEEILNEARHASAEGPWDLSALRYKKIVFLQLVKLLPESEGEQLSFDFLGEYNRIEELLAA